mgnify:CR=1 FL=1
MIQVIKEILVMCAWVGVVGVVMLAMLLVVPMVARLFGV